MALAITQAARNGATGLLHDAQHHHHPTRLACHGLKGHLHITKKASVVKAFDVLLQGAAVKHRPGLERNLTGHHIGLGFTLDGLALVVRGGAFFVNELHLHALHRAFAHLKLHIPIRADPTRPGNPGQGITLIGIPLLQFLHAHLQGVEVEGLAVIGRKGVLDQLGGQFGLA